MRSCLPRGPAHQLTCRSSARLTPMLQIQKRISFDSPWFFIGALQGCGSAFNFLPIRIKLFFSIRFRIQLLSQCCSGLGSILKKRRCDFLNLLKMTPPPPIRSEENKFTIVLKIKFQIFSISLHFSVFIFKFFKLMWIRIHSPGAVSADPRCFYPSTCQTKVSMTFGFIYFQEYFKIHDVPVHKWLAVFSQEL